MNIYQRLGLKTIINASDTYTRIGGSRMDPDVLKAMCEASKFFVDINMLQEKVGERIAELTGNEAAFVTTGAAAGLVLSVASCMTCEQEELMIRLPNTAGFPRNEFIVFKSQCRDINPYWHLIELTGGNLIKVNSSMEDLKSAICTKTAGIIYFAGTLYEEDTPSVVEVIRIAEGLAIPVIVDAAAQLPPVENMWHYTRKLGADLVLFSGGKFIMGPQSSGIILGKRHLIDACRKNSFPNVLIGRPFKVGKEEMVALLTAVEKLVMCDSAEQTKKFNKILDAIEQGISTSFGIKMTRTNKGRLGQTIPLLLIELPKGKSSLDCHYFLSSHESPIDIGYFHNGDPRLVFVNPINLKEGEVSILIDGIREYLDSKYKSNI
jgi:uncharacterized pyridoxal phosphate-dependent enzyme